MLASDLPASATSALTGLTIRKGRRGDLVGYRENLRLQRERQEGRLEFLDRNVSDTREQARQAEEAAYQARREVALIDGQLAALDAALATPEAMA